MDQLTFWIHILSLAGYVGTTLTLLVVILPAVERLERHDQRLDLLTTLLARLDPLIIAVLGCLVMSGAFSLTAYKARLGSEFFTRIGEPLTLKLILAFVLINGTTYLVFGLGHRLVRAVQWGDPVSPERLAGIMRRLRMVCVGTLALAAWIVWVSIAIPTGASLP